MNPPILVSVQQLVAFQYLLQYNNLELNLFELHVQLIAFAANAHQNTE
jgi:hypothetical protein